ncbi:hypothetical protein BN126310015 [Stenotrophomonas maltophilia]|nr:hypothetical protein BN126310015 [Stenotrophomonas maltophilia]CRD65641.1 hypothetical protein BN126370047 [Stenotrophomonas maltophilia]
MRFVAIGGLSYEWDGKNRKF